jgi:DNA polymerase (family X)
LGGVTCALRRPGAWQRAIAMNNEQIAERFYRLANLMEIRGDDRYRIRSYRNAAETIETWPTPMLKIAREEGARGLQTIPGVGKAISGKIMELLEGGTFEAWEKLIGETPATVLDLLRVSGIGIKTAATLHQQFKIASLDDLKKFSAGGGLEMVEGIGEKSAERIRENLRRL